MKLNDRKVQRIMKARHRNPDAGAIAIENYLLETEMAMEDPNKKKQRKWVRYERKHSNSMWHMDWSEYNGEQLLVIEDDASRFIVGFGSFDSATTENTLVVLRKNMEEHGAPGEIMTDHGTQFFSNGKGGEPGEPNEFQRYLSEKRIRHILARVKHLQTNGKLERVNGTLKNLTKYFDTWDEILYYYNNRRRHMSLSSKERPVVTPAMAYEEKMSNGEEEEAV